MNGLLQTFLQIMLYNKINTQNPFLDALLISLVGYGLSYIQRYDLLDSLFFLILYNILIRFSQVIKYPSRPEEPIRSLFIVLSKSF